jgi:CheY-like chemotaxis protein
MRIFILEDDPYRHKVFKRELADFDITIKEDTDTAVKCLLTEGPFDLFFWDHDLGLKQMVTSADYETGYEVVKQINASGNDVFHKQSVHVVHSLNPAGAKNIQGILPMPCVINPFIHIDWGNVRHYIMSRWIDVETNE